MLTFAVGSAAIIWPQVGLPIVGGLGLLKVIKNRTNKSRQHQARAKEWNETKLISNAAVRPPPVRLSWTGITCTLTSKDGSEKLLLDNVTGEAIPGRLLAILGPSGSGKTTLLSALASQMPTGTNIQLTGQLAVNSKPATESNHRQGYVQQDDVFYSMLTVRETLTMAAELRLPASMSVAEKRDYIDRLMATLNLTKEGVRQDGFHSFECPAYADLRHDYRDVIQEVANSRVGDAKKRGLSGGERKRLSLGCELVGSPSLIFLDEPTSGLDAAAAEKVMFTLKQLAAVGHTIVCSIHQPRSSIWEMFDDVVLLHEGKLVYSGPADQALPHFAALGHVCPPAHNPAEFLSDLISPDYASLTGTPDNDEQGGKHRVQLLVDAWAASPQPRANVTGSSSEPSEDAAVHEGAGLPPGPLVSWTKQFKLLAKRSWWQVTRDKAATIARLGANISSAIVFGSIFFRMKRSQSSIQDRLGLMQVVAINTAMSSLAKTLNVFPRERLIINRERARHAHTPATYLPAKLLAELPLSAIFPIIFGCLVYPVCGLNSRPERFAKFLGIVSLASFASSAFGMVVGAMVPTTEAALAIGPAAMTVWASLIKQAFAALTINEMEGSTFEPDAQGRGMTDGKQVLDWLSFGNTTVGSACLQQLRILGVYYVATYAILNANKPRFQPVLPPRSKTTPEALPIANRVKSSATDDDTSATAAPPAMEAQIGTGTAVALAAAAALADAIVTETDA